MPFVSVSHDSDWYTGNLQHGRIKQTSKFNKNTHIVVQGISNEIELKKSLQWVYDIRTVSKAAIRSTQKIKPDKKVS